jgi:hypothetical protein
VCSTAPTHRRALHRRDSSCSSIRDTRVPFILVDPPIAASAPGGEMAGTPVVSKTKSCYKTNETTGDCGPDDPAPKLTAGYF